MDDLISRAAAIERMKSMAGCATCDNYNGVRCRACIWDDAMNIVEEMSEVNAAQVIRCRDCKWFDCKNYVCNNDILAGRIADCGCYPNFNVEPDWFCADGERRDSE